MTQSSTNEAQILAAHEELKMALKDAIAAQELRNAAESATQKAEERESRARAEIDRLAYGREKWVP